MSIRTRCRGAGRKRSSQIVQSCVLSFFESLETRRLLSGTTIYVDQSATGANSGADWADAYTNLQTALSAAQADGPSASNPITINVAQGTYSPGGSSANTFQLINEVALNGGFPSGG